MLLVINTKMIVDINFANLRNDVSSLSVFVPIINPSKNPYIVEENIANREILYWVKSNNKNKRVITP
jgi:hypothetical protein